MTKLRVLIFLLTLVIVGTVGTFVSFYARGFRFDTKTLKFIPNGLMVLKSDPDGASVYVDGELKTATNATIPLNPGTYDIEIRKDGFSSWKKRLTIEKEIVTEADAFLFRLIPSFSPITSSGVASPVPSPDLTKAAYGVLPTEGNGNDKIGLYLLDTLNLPLGFPRDPRRITDGDITGSSWQFSPDGNQILLTKGASAFLLDATVFTAQAQRVNIASQKDTILANWEKERIAKRDVLAKNLPGEIGNLLTKKAQDVVFSPDETKILYTASASATLSNNLIPPVIGASTQKQERDIKVGNTYIYDIKEDKNFLITNQDVTLTGQDSSMSGVPALRWFPTSKHLILAENGKITIMDYDGTNRQIVYSGGYIFPNAFPYLNTGRLLILTNLGGSNSTPNLYSLSLK